MNAISKLGYFVRTDQLTRYFLEEFTNVIRDQSNPVYVRQQMDPAIVEIPDQISMIEPGRGGLSLLESCSIWPNHMNLILPRENNRIVATPLDIFGYSFGLGIIFTILILKVATYHPNLTILCIKRK